MCYHVSNEHEIEQLELEFGLPAREIVHFKPRFDANGFEKPYQPIISIQNPKEIVEFRWGLVPHWVKEEKSFKANTLNARNDELFEKPSYRQYWQNRCLLLCTGFFEPHYPVLNGKEHESWYMKPKTKKYFALGSIFSVWEGIPTFSIITTDASPLLATVHNDGKRQPLILTGAYAKAWLNPELTRAEMTELMKWNYPDEEITAYRTMDGVYNARLDTNVPDVIQPYVDKPFDVLDFFLRD